MSAINSMLGSVLRKVFSLHLFRWSLTPFVLLHLKHNLIAILLLLFSFAGGEAHAACASYTGKVVINEYNYIQNWIELKVLDTTLTNGVANPFAAVKLAIWGKQGGTMVLQKEVDVSSNYTDLAKNTCNSSTNNVYIQNPFSVTEMSNDVIVVLWKTDEGTKGRVIDVFRLGQSALAAYPASINAGYTNYDQCPAIESGLPSSLYDAPLVGSSNNKDITRLPDGTGPWVISNGTGSNSQQSLCTSNDALFKLSKTPSSASVGIGFANPFNWTIIVNNGGTTGNLSNTTISDTLPANMFLSACPAGASCSGAVGAYTSFSINVGTLKPIGSTPNAATISTTAYVTVAGTYTNTAQATATELTPGYVLASGTVTTPSAPGSFNAFEGTTPAADIIGIIKTKISGSAFALDVVAISGGVKASGFADTVKVELLGNAVAGVALDGNNCPTSYTLLQTVTPNPAISGGRSMVNIGAVTEAWKDVRVRISYPAATPTVISCSTDNFAIRPNSLSIGITDADWQTAGTTNTLDNTAASGVVVHKAGRPFTLQATARNAAAATTTNYAGTPTALLSACADTACTAAFGAFSPGTGTAVAGVINSTTASYSEVGAFTLQLQDKTFADVDASDGSVADCAGRFVCSTLVNAGRFVPDHFDTVVVSSGGVPMACTSGLTCPALDSTAPAVTGMVYAGQSFTTQVTARNAAGLTTFNYNTTTGLSKAVTLSAWDALGSSTTQNPGPGTLANPAIAAVSFVNGAASIFTTSYSFTVTPTVPTAIYLRAVDSDNVSSLRSTPSSSAEGGVEVVRGRIKISNAYGSELLPLTLTAAAQYYGASGWLSNVADAVTPLTFPATFAVGTGTTAVTLLPVSGVLTGGVLTVKLGKPSSGAGIATITPTGVPSYLTVIPGTATFGIYKGNLNFIYQSESY